MVSSPLSKAIPLGWTMAARLRSKATKPLAAPPSSQRCRLSGARRRGAGETGGVLGALGGVVEAIVTNGAPIRAGVREVGKPVSGGEKADEPLVSTLAKTLGDCPKQFDM